MSIDVIRLAREAGFRSGNIQLSVGDPIPFISPISATNCLVELERFAALVMEECAKVCEDLIDKKEEARAALRAAKAIDSDDEDDMLAALKHESNVSLYGAGISKCAAAIRARKPA